MMLEHFLKLNKVQKIELNEYKNHEARALRVPDLIHSAAYNWRYISVV
ncbi:MAG: hypothetical protein HLUCCO06_13435 [Halomonas sp. HL-93]|nr:MAG: hypothetical protein HLUCCO06_13435 [Halomonas sp. HL-93]